MKSFALRPSEERSVYINQYAATHGIPAYIAEKDFWVCWLLARIFSTPSLGSACVFKGGTSLSKVFGAIERFSEDIDLALSSDSLGWSEEELDEAPSPTKRRKLVKNLIRPAPKPSKAVSTTNWKPPSLPSSAPHLPERPGLPTNSIPRPTPQNSTSPTPKPFPPVPTFHRWSKWSLAPSPTRDPQALTESPPW